MSVLITGEAGAPLQLAYENPWVVANSRKGGIVTHCCSGTNMFAQKVLRVVILERKQGPVSEGGRFGMLGLWGGGSSRELLPE